MHTRTGEDHGRWDQGDLRRGILGADRKPIREPLGPNIAVVIETPEQLRSLAANADLAKALEGAGTHLVVSVEHTEQIEHTDGDAAAGVGDHA